MSTRTILELGSRCVRTWWFWAFFLLVTPNCMLQTNGLCQDGDPPPCPQETKPCPDPENPECPPCPPEHPDCNTPPVCPDPSNPLCDPMPPTQVFDPGQTPTDAIMCDFPAPADPSEKPCALPSEISDPLNVWLNQAATALATGRSSPLSLDFGPNAQNLCGGPTKSTYLGGGPFPNGTTVCINYSQQVGNGKMYASDVKACIAKCEDLINFGNVPFAPANVHDYCVANVHTSTNYKQTDFVNACSAGGNPLPGFDDKRKYAEPLVWNDLSAGMSYDPATKQLTRTAATTGGQLTDLNEGAASAQVIKGGDAWVELQADTTNTTFMVSLRNSCADPATCPDNVPGVGDLGVALEFHSSGEVFLFDSVSSTTSPSFGPYTAGERYRLKVTDNHDGSAVISASRLIGACTPGTVCNENEFGPNFTVVPYPLRLDVTTLNQGTTLSNVNMVYIHQ